MSDESATQLAEFCTSISYERIPKHVIEHAKTCVLDTLGVMVTGRQLGFGVDETIRILSKEAGAGVSTVVGERERFPVRAAALANGATAHQLDFDDTHDKAVIHPTANSLPLALALAERSGRVEGRTFLEAIVAGNEVACRLGGALTGDLFDYPWVRPPLLGMFGAVAAGARIAGLTSEQLVNAWGLVLPRAGGTLSCLVEPGSWVRTMRDGFSGDSAALAVLLSEEGVQGDRNPISGRYGVLESYFPNGYDLDRPTNELGERYLCEEVSIKPWPCCREVHGTLTAVMELIEENSIAADDVEQVNITVGSTNLKLCEPADIRRHPKSKADALCNLPYNIASALVHSGIPLSIYTPEGLRDEKVHKMADRVFWQYDKYQDRFGTLEPGNVSIVATNGRVFDRSVDVARGNYDNPLSTLQLEKKFHDCCSADPDFDQERIDRIVKLIWELDELAQVDTIGDYLRPAD